MKSWIIVCNALNIEINGLWENRENKENIDESKLGFNALHIEIIRMWDNKEHNENVEKLKLECNVLNIELNGLWEYREKEENIRHIHKDREWVNNTIAIKRRKDWSAEKKKKILSIFF